MEQIRLDVETKEVEKREVEVKEEVKENKAKAKEVKENKAKEEKERKKKEQEEIKAKAKEEKEKAKAIIDELKEKLINDITTKNKDLKENVTIKPTSKYIGVRYKGKVIAELEQVARGLIVRVLDIYGDDFPSEVNNYVTKEGENDLLIKKCPSRFGWRTNCELLLQNKKQYKQCFDGLKMSIEVLKKEIEEKAKAKEEKAKAKEENKKEEK